MEGGETMTRMDKIKILVDRKVYSAQLGTIDTALREMRNTPESFELFINRMIDLGVMSKIKLSRAEVKRLQEQACLLAWLEEDEDE